MTSPQASPLARATDAMPDIAPEQLENARPPDIADLTAANENLQEHEIALLGPNTIPDIPAHNSIMTDNEVSAHLLSVTPNLDPTVMGDFQLNNPEPNAFAQNGFMTGLDIPSATQEMANMTAEVSMGGPFAPNLAMDLFEGNRAEDMFMPQSLLELGPSPFIVEQPRKPTHVSAYAKLEFEDGEFYMNTYHVVLGRDLVAYKAFLKRQIKESKRENPKTTPGRIKRERSHFSRSVVSEKGGIMRDRRPLHGMGITSRHSRSDSQSSHSWPKQRPDHEPGNQAGYNPLSYNSAIYTAIHTDNVVPVDPDTLRPDPWTCPLIGIHPNAVTGIGSYKNISRKHVKIAFNSEKHVFEADILGRNGAFFHRDSPESSDMQHHGQGSRITLTSGCYLQIADVRVRFVLPDVQLGETGENRPDYVEGAPRSYSEGAKEMSFEFQESRHVTQDSDDDEVFEGYQSGDHRGISNDRDEDQERSQEAQDREEVEEEELSEEKQSSPSNSSNVGNKNVSPKASVKKVSAAPRVEKKRGVGRPPKDGIMSQREKVMREKIAREEEAQAQKNALANKQVKNEAEDHTGGKGDSIDKAKGKGKKPAPTENTEVDASGVPIKRGVGRPRKHPRPEETEEPRAKRKYTKRKPREPQEGKTKEEGSGAENTAVVPKEKPPPKEPSVPPLKLFIEDYTEEQLQKPSGNYVQMIYEALLEAPGNRLTLPMLYQAIERKYPYFHFKTQTNGWQSSVRHNLGQHSAFQKEEKHGKGFYWILAPGASIQKEKKRRLTPPPQGAAGHMQSIYPNQYHQMMAHPSHMGPPPLGYNYGGPPPGHSPYMAPQPHYGGPSPPYSMGPHPHPSPYATMNGPAHGITPVMPHSLAAPNVSTAYSSPYAPKPPVSNAPPQTQPNNQPQQSQQDGQSQLLQANGQPYSTQPLGQPQLAEGGNESSRNQTLGGQSIQQSHPTVPVLDREVPPALPLSPPTALQQISQQPPMPQIPSPPSKIEITAESSNDGLPDRFEPTKEALAAVKMFKDIMQSSGSSNPNGPAIVDSVINQLLYGASNDLPASDLGAAVKIRESLINLLQRVKSGNMASIPEATSKAAKQLCGPTGGPSSSRSPLETRPNGMISTAPQLSTTPMGSYQTAPVGSSRLQFSENNHAHGNAPPQARPSIPRPAMGTPSNGMKRASSGSPAPWINASASTAAPLNGNGVPTVNGGSAPVLAASHIQVLTQEVQARDSLVPAPMKVQT